MKIKITSAKNTQSTSCVRSTPRFKKRYILIVILVLLLCASAFKIYDSRKTIALFYSAVSMSSQDIEAMQKNYDDQIEQTLGKLTDTPIRNLTDEEKELLKRGELSKKDAAALIIGSNDVTETSTPDEQSGIQKPDPSKKNEIIARIYVLRSEFEGKIDSLIDSQIQIYRSYPAKERNTTLKLQMAQDLMAKGTALEGQCDALMEELLTELKAELIKNDEDTTLVDTARKLYSEAKEIKKAELISTYYPKINN